MYLYNKSKNIIDLPTGETLFPGCFSAYISSSQNTLIQPILASGMVQVLNSLNGYEALGYRIPLCYGGDISKSNEFPSLLEVTDGMLFIIRSDTIDGNPEKTNTGKTFEQGQTIIWYRGTWWELSRCTQVIDLYSVLLLHCDGTEGSTIFTDSSSAGNTIIANGSAHIDTTIKKFGTGSALFDGSGDYLTAPDSDYWRIGTGDFCIDLQVNPVSFSGNPVLVAQLESGSQFWILNFDSSGHVVFENYNFGYTVQLVSTVTATLHMFNHIALTRKNTEFNLFINGINGLSTTSSGAVGPFYGDLSIGAFSTASQPLYGRIDELRISKGSARIDDPEDKLYIPSGIPIDGFIPPTSAYGT